MMRVLGWLRHLPATGDRKWRAIFVVNLSKHYPHGELNFRGELWDNESTYYLNSMQQKSALKDGISMQEKLRSSAELQGF